MPPVTTSIPVQSWLASPLIAVLNTDILYGSWCFEAASSVYSLSFVLGKLCSSESRCRLILVPQY